jgi:hypothetical protein
MRVTILKSAKKEKIPVVFAMTKNSLARALLQRRGHSSVVGILSFDGAEVQFKDMIQRCDQLR